MNLANMESVKFVKIGFSLLFIILLVLNFSNNTFSQDKKPKPKVTFIELGSVNCIPCKKMQPIMKSIKERYGEQLEVIFYDVWKPEQKKFAEIYRIRVIPTQVFLDDKGKEFFRHEGFFPESEIDKILQNKGLKVKK
ncbi:MAG: thioredoxin family protein [Candidatus Kapaibacteriota bacterium]